MTETRIALISGANRGIGLEIARQLARRGLIAVIGTRDPANGQAAVESLATESLVAAVVQLDVTNAESVAGAVKETLELYGRIDVLVNNAGVLLDGPGGFQSSLLELRDDVARLTFETNVLGPVRLIQAVMPAMRERGYGRIANVSSGAGQLSEMGAGFPAYRMSKAALNALTRLTAAEIGPGNIKINAMCPGWVRTDMGGVQASRSVEEGADTAVWLATLEEDGPTGGFFRDRKPIAW